MPLLGHLTVIITAVVAFASFVMYEASCQEANDSQILQRLMQTINKYDQAGLRFLASHDFARIINFAHANDHKLLAIKRYLGRRDSTDLVRTLLRNDIDIMFQQLRDRSFSFTGFAKDPSLPCLPLPLYPWIKQNNVHMFAEMNAMHCSITQHLQRNSTLPLPSEIHLILSTFLDNLVIVCATHVDEVQVNGHSLNQTEWKHKLGPILSIAK